MTYTEAYAECLGDAIIELRSVGSLFLRFLIWFLESEGVREASM